MSRAALQVSSRVIARVRSWGIWAIAALFVTLAPVPAAASYTCRAPLTTPYLKPLEALPALHSPPERGPLPFAPAVYLKPANVGALVAQGETIGFTVAIRSPMGGGRFAKPALKVMATISVVGRDGAVRTVVKQIENDLGHGRPADLTYVTPKTPAMYRVDVVFERRDGTRAGSYAEYFRAAPRRFDARLALSDDQLAPGEVLSARLENIGVTRIGAGYGYGVERFNGTFWETDPVLQGKRLIPKVLVIIPPGNGFDCYELQIPVDQPPGLYRLVKDVRRTGIDGHGSAIVTRSFTVLGL